MTEESQSRPRLWHQSRFRVLVGILTPLITLFLILQFLDWLEENSSDDKVDRIKREMTKKEVQDILGPPSYPSSGEAAGAEKMRWNFPDEGVIYVYFNSDGKVANKEWGEHHSRPKRGLKELISHWLKKLGL